MRIATQIESLHTRSPKSRFRARVAIVDLAALVALVILSCVVLGPVLFHLNQWLYGIGQDGTSAVNGVTQRLAAARHGGILAPLTSLTGAPFPDLGAGDAASPLWWYAGVGLAFFLTPIGATNILILLSFVFTSAATYLFLRFNGLKPVPATLGALVYGFCPTRLAQGQEHFGSLDDFWFVLECAFLLQLLRRGQWGTGIALGVGIALAELDNPYLGYFAGILAAMAFVVILGLGFVRRDGRSARTGAITGAIAVGIVIIIIIPTQYQLFHQVQASSNPTITAGPLVRDLSDVDRLSLRWWNFFLPSPDNPVLGPLGRSTFYAHLGPGTVTEQSTMIGYIALGLAITGAWAAFRKGGNKSGQSDATQGVTLGASPGPKGDHLASPSETLGRRRDLATIAVVCIGSGILFGLPPEFHVGPFVMPMPSYFVHAVLPEIRTIVRLDLIIQLGIAILAALGAALLLSKVRSPGRRTMLAGALAVGILLEYTNAPPWRYVQLLPAPPLDQWLTSLSPAEAGIVVQYPIEIVASLARTPLYAFYAYDVHHHPLFNAVAPGTPPDALRRILLDVLNPTNPASWAALGVKTLTVDTTYYDEFFHNTRLNWSDGIDSFVQQMPVGLSRRYSDLKAQGYTVTAKPALVVAGLGNGFGDGILEHDGREWSWIGGKATIWLDNVTPSAVQVALWAMVHNNVAAHDLSWPGAAPVHITLAQQSSPVAITTTVQPGFHSFQISAAGPEQALPHSGGGAPVRVEVRSFEPAPIRPLQADFSQGNTVTWRLTGVSADACRLQAGSTLDVALFWSVQSPTNDHETVFLHLLNSSGNLVAQGDGDPDGGAVDTQRLAAGTHLSDVHRIPLPTNLPPGNYQLEAGLYNRQTAARMVTSTGVDHVSVGMVTVVAPGPGPVTVPCGW